MNKTNVSYCNLMINTATEIMELIGLQIALLLLRTENTIVLESSGRPLLPGRQGYTAPPLRPNTKKVVCPQGHKTFINIVFGPHSIKQV
jgi:hypothetical protein